MSNDKWMEGVGRRIHLSVAMRWLITAQASSGRAFLISNIHSTKRFGQRVVTYVLIPPLIMSTALVVPTRDLINGSSKAMDSTAFKALSDLVDAKIAFLVFLSISVEWTAVHRRLS